MDLDPLADETQRLDGEVAEAPSKRFINLQVAITREPPDPVDPLLSLCWRVVLRQTEG
jgi:hypothetical protein